LFVFGVVMGSLYPVFSSCRLFSLPAAFLLQYTTRQSVFGKNAKIGCSWVAQLPELANHPPPENIRHKEVMGGSALGKRRTDLMKHTINVKGGLCRPYFRK
jgi:hypothetical protein